MRFNLAFLCLRGVFHPSNGSSSLYHIIGKPAGGWNHSMTMSRPFSPILTLHLGPSFPSVASAILRDGLYSRRTRMCYFSCLRSWICLPYLNTLCLILGAISCPCPGSRYLFISYLLSCCSFGAFCMWSLFSFPSAGSRSTLDVVKCGLVASTLEEFVLDGSFVCYLASCYGISE